MKNRKFNGSLQQALLRRTDWPVVRWSGGGGKSAFGLTAAGFRVGVGGCGVTDRRGRVLGRELVGAGQGTLTGRQFPSGKPLTAHPLIELIKR